MLLLLCLDFLFLASCIIFEGVLKLGKVLSPFEGSICPQDNAAVKRSERFLSVSYEHF